VLQGGLNTAELPVHQAGLNSSGVVESSVDTEFHRCPPSRGQHLKVRMH